MCCSAIGQSAATYNCKALLVTSPDLYVYIAVVVSIYMWPFNNRYGVTFALASFLYAVHNRASQLMVEQSLTPHPTQYRSFQRRSSQPITWLILTNKAVQENKHAKTKYKSDKADKLKYSTTKLPWYSHLLRHSARKRGGLILQWYQTWAPKPTRGAS